MASTEQFMKNSADQEKADLEDKSTLRFNGKNLVVAKSFQGKKRDKKESVFLWTRYLAVNCNHGREYFTVFSKQNREQHQFARFRTRFSATIGTWSSLGWKWKPTISTRTVLQSSFGLLKSCELKDTKRYCGESYERMFYWYRIDTVVVRFGRWWIEGQESCKLQSNWRSSEVLYGVFWYFLHFAKDPERFYWR